MKRFRLLKWLMLILISWALGACVKEEEKALEIVSTREVVNNGNIIVEALFEDASRMYFRLVSPNEAEVTCAYEYFPEEEEFWKYAGKVVIPEEFTHYGQVYRVVGIGRAAFNSCESLTEVLIPESVIRYVDEAAFAGSVALESVKMPSHIEKVGTGAFAGCAKLAAIEIPEGPAEIYDYTFKGCESLTEIRMPQSVERVGFSAFFGCRNLKKVDLESVTVVGLGAFGGCESLEEVVMPKMEYVSRSAFLSCTGLRSVDLPDTVETVSGFAFRGCTSLTSVICRAIVPPRITLPGDVYEDPFEGCQISEIKVPTESVNAYKTAKDWFEYADKIVGL